MWYDTCTSGNNKWRLLFTTVEVSGAVAAAPRLIGARLNSSTDQYVSGNQETVINFNFARYDTSGFGGPATGSGSRIQIARSGVYHVGACAWFTPTALLAGGPMGISLTLNSGTRITTSQSTTDNSAKGFNVATDYYFNMGDYIQLHANISPSNHSTIVALGNYSPEMWIHFVGD
mgnify:FL=1